jgi:uncharacterized membrane protein
LTQKCKITKVYERRKERCEALDQKSSKGIELQLNDKLAIERGRYRVCITVISECKVGKQLDLEE